MIFMMESYAAHLEALVDERSAELAEEKQRIENIVLRMLPK